MIQSGVVAASFALAANAFIIPSTVSLPAVKGDGLAALKRLQLAGAAHVVSGERVVKLGCPGCSFKGVEGSQNDMVLKWSVSEDGKVLRLNGEDFYGKEGTALHGFPTVQVPHDTAIEALNADISSVATSARPLFYHAKYRYTPAADGTDDELIDLDFSVNSLGQEQVHDADRLNLRLLKDSEARLAISDIVTVPADNSQAPQEDTRPPPAPPAMEHEEGERRKTFTILPISPMIKSSPNGAPACLGHSASFCRFVEAFKAKVAAIHNAIQAAKAAHNARLGAGTRHPCHGNSMGHMDHHGPSGMTLHGGVRKIKLWIFRIGGHKQPQPVEAAQQEKAPVEAAPAHEDHPHHHAHLHGMHRMSHVMHNVFFGFFVPVLIGIAAGMTASLLGMVVGTGIAMLWFKIRRGGRRGNASDRTVEAAKEDVIVDDEKIRLMETERECVEYEDAPPLYKDDA